MNNTKYRPFENYILRVPFFSFNDFLELTKGAKVPQGKLLEKLEDPIVNEAIFLASPHLHSELMKWKNNPDIDKKKSKKLALTLLKYLSRMSTRCTPFGLFAGCTLGKLSDETSITIGDPANHKRHTRLDMDFLVALAQDLAKDKTLMRQLRYYPNSSLYRIGDKLRYIEYSYDKGTRKHEIVSVDSSEYLLKLLDLSDGGCLFAELTETLVSMEIGRQDAESFIVELIENQVLVSELEPSVTGPEFLHQIKKTLRKYSALPEIVRKLERIEQILLKIDNSVGNNLNLYKEATDLIKGLGTDFNVKFLFQTDLFINTTKNKLNQKVAKDLLVGLEIINRLSSPPSRSNLNSFMNSMYERYGEREMPLAKVLDTETGIPYRKNIDGDINPLVDDLVLPEKEKRSPKVREFKFSESHILLNKKIREALINKKTEIEISPSDFEHFETNWTDLPATISLLIEVAELENENVIKIRSTGGSSAANLMARFCHGSKEIREHTFSIIEREEELLEKEDTAIAEIAHLPDNRTGNILLRPSFRKYEIPYLASSSLSEENQIHIDDLTIRARFNTQIVMKSIEKKKIIIPRLTNAHNYSYNTLPVYNFLCDLQNQGIRAGISFSIGPLYNEYKYIPRIRYKNIILREASWNFKREEFNILFKCYDNDDILRKEIRNIRKLYNLPDFLVFADGDYEMVINLNNIDSFRNLIDLVKNKNQILLKEFLHHKSSIVTSKNGSKHYCNQFIISYFKN